MKASLWLLVFALRAFAQLTPGSYSVLPVAGGGRGDLGPATQAVLDGPSGLAQDANGNVYISETNAGVIRRVRTDGTIERFAGSGLIGDTPEGSPALQTDLSAPTHLLIDVDGGLIFADALTCRIRKVGKDGIVHDLVGIGTCSATGGFGRPGGGNNRLQLGPETLINSIGAMVLDSSGLLVFTDTAANVIRRLDADGYVRIIAGTGALGFFGDGGDPTQASLRAPVGLAYDIRGTLYIGDGSNCRVRAIDSTGIINTVAGTGTCAPASTTFSIGSPNRSIGRLASLAYDPNSDTLYMSTPGAYRVLSLDLGQSRLSAFAGSGRLGVAFSSDPLATDINNVAEILVSANGGLLVSSDNSYQVYLVRDNTMQTFAGSWPQVASYPAPLSASLVRPAGLALNADGSLLLADSGAQRILQIQPPDQMTAKAGARYPSGYSQGDGVPATDAVLYSPARILVAPGGDIYFTETTRIRAIGADGAIRTVLDFLSQPFGLTLDPGGNLVYSEAGAHRVVAYNLTTKIRTTIAGINTSAGFSGDGAAATAAQLNSPGDVVYDSKGNLWIADRGNRRVRRVGTNGVIQTMIGSARGFSFDDITGQAANDIGLARINGLAIDRSDNLYIAEPTRVSYVGNDGAARVLLGFLSQSDDGRNTYRMGAINNTDGIAVDASGRLYYSLPLDGKVMVAASN